MIIQKNANLKNFNSFHLNIKADFLITINSKEDLVKLSELIQNKKFVILGDGTNVLFTQDFNGIVILNRIKGKQILYETKNDIIIEVAAGENWDNFVKFTVDKNLFGLENLSGIPGTVGAAPIQNIGAYGAEVKNNIIAVKFFDFEKQKIIILENEKCHFAYRHSIFKDTLKNKGIISSVIFKLSKNEKLNLSYSELEKEIKKIGKKDLKTIRNTILKIRKRKLPDYNILGNSGSFFKNPIIDEKSFLKLKKNYPQIPFYKVPEGIKIPAAWLIDKAGLKGKTIGKAMIYPKQPLVIVNTGNAEPMDIVILSEYVKTIIKDKFDINLVPEVNFIK